MVRLTAAVRQQLLDQNEGFTARTFNQQRNSEETRHYRIEGGQLRVRAVGKTSWADSRYDKEYVAPDDETHRFLRKHLHELNRDGLD